LVPFASALEKLFRPPRVQGQAAMLIKSKLPTGWGAFNLMDELLVRLRCTQPFHRINGGGNKHANFCRRTAFSGARAKYVFPGTAVLCWITFQWASKK